MVRLRENISFIALIVMVILNSSFLWDKLNDTLDEKGGTIYAEKLVLTNKSETRRLELKADDNVAGMWITNKGKDGLNYNSPIVAIHADDVKSTVATYGTGRKDGPTMMMGTYEDNPLLQARDRHGRLYKMDDFLNNNGRRIGDVGAQGE